VVAVLPGKGLGADVVVGVLDLGGVAVGASEGKHNVATDKASHVLGNLLPEFYKRWSGGVARNKRRRG
jgi:hypothetical protein